MQKNNKFAALLRGINVGGSGVIKMNELTGLFEKSGCKNVSTYIQSGNVVFEAENHEGIKAKLLKLIKSNYGFEPVIMIYTIKAFEEILHNNPYKGKEGNRVHFFFMETRANRPDIDKLDSLKTAGEQYQITDRVLYLYAPDGIGRSKFAVSVEKCLGVAVTARNLNTVEKINSMLQN